jgi:tetratricopeptide (TPR) repeat protein
MKKTIISLVAIALVIGIPAYAEKNWKDRAEYDLYTEITKPDATPAARLQNLEKWKAAYPQSEYADTRQKIYLITYQQMNNHRAAFDMANEILKTDPNDAASVQEILGYLRALMPTKPSDPLTPQNKADLDTAEKLAHTLLANPDAIYGADKKPAGVDDAAWAKTKPTMVNFAQFTLGYIGATQKDPAKAETELTKTLQMDPTNAQASYMLAGVLLAQQKEHPEKMPVALFEYARAATYDGPGSLDANTRKSIDGFLTKAYGTYHGSPQGLDQIKMAAKAGALPAADSIKIKSTVDIAKEEEEKRQAAAKENPMLAFWNEIKEALTSPDTSDKYWDAMKGAGLPPMEKVPSGKFTGKLISASPEVRPKELKIAIEKPDVADVTLILEEPLPGKMEPGGDISFFGAPEAMSKDPYMITFKVDKENLVGWTGKGVARPAGATKKAAPAAPKKQ